jgi:hypothetical protein
MADEKSNSKKYRFVFEPMVPKGLLEPPEWAIEGLMPETGITCLFGKPGSFKTFVAIGMAACKAAGLEFCGRWVGPPCKGGYIAADAPKGAKLRAKAWVQAHQALLDEQDIDEDLLDANLKVLEIPVNLYKPGEVDEAIRGFEEQKFGVEVLVVDTLFHSSIGAKLTQPEEILPLLVQLRRLMEAVGAKACLLVHHTTKDGEEFFGSVSFLATVEAMIKSEWKDENTARVECKRMREDAFFSPFEIAFTKQKVKTRRNKKGVDEFEFLVVGGGAPAAKPMTKEARNLESMEWCLDILGGSATRAEWYEEVKNFTAKRENGKIVKEGWSEDKFDRLRRKLVEQGRVTGGGAQDVCYELVKAAKPGQAGGCGPLDPSGPPVPQAPANPGSNHPHPHSLLGNAGSAGGFDYPQTTRKRLCGWFARKWKRTKLGCAAAQQDGRNRERQHEHPQAPGGRRRHHSPAGIGLVRRSRQESHSTA